jgi:haloalkane dehalogenase
MSSVLLTTPVGPYDTHYYNQSLTDVMDQRFSRGCDIFTMRGHIHINFAHVLAQNIQAPTVFLEYPTWEDFETEIANKPTIIGINGFHNQRDIVVQMAKRARVLSPESTILLGGWAGVGVKSCVPEDEWKQYADDICEGEGVGFLREKLGEDVNAPIDVTHLPKCAAAIPWLEPHPEGDMGTVVASLGCPHGCDFCGTTHMYSRRRVRLLKADKVFDEMKRYFRDHEKLVSINLIEEDSFADPKFMRRLSELVCADEEFGIERLNFFCLSSNSSLSKFDFDDILRTGVSSIFIGVESKFAPGEGYKKRDGRTIDETFRELHRRGIGTIGAWMLGFDFQNRENVTEDLNAFIDLEPTFQQLTRLCPFPGTTLWRRLVEEERIDPKQIPTEAISFFGGGGMVPENFYDHEIMELIESGYVKLYETWGACMFRQWKVGLNGFEYCSTHDDPIIRRRAEFHRRMVHEIYPLTLAMEYHAPNGTVRKKVRDQRTRYFKNFGEPSTAQKLLEKFVLRKAHKAAKDEQSNPINFRPKEEPYKRYEYARTAKPGEQPYTVTHPSRELSYQIHDMRRRARTAVLGGIAQLLNNNSKKARTDAKGKVQQFRARHVL